MNVARSVSATFSVTSTAITVSLSANRVTGVAPLSVFFDATGTVSPGVTAQPFHDIKYTWNFGDTAGGATWGYGTRPNQMSKNVAYGAMAGHVFETPGTYTVTVSAFDGTNTNSKTTTITVTDPNVVFSGTNTVCVANGSAPVAGVNGCPVGADVRNLATTQAIVQLGSLGNKRILLKRGDHWDVSGTEYLKASNGIIGAYGSGAAPWIRIATGNSAFYFLDGVSNWTFMDLDFVGAGGVNPIIVTSGAGHSNITALRLGQTSTGGIIVGFVDGFFVQDCNGSGYIGGGGHVGIYAEIGSRIAILGNRVYDATQIEHNIRMQGNYKIVISNNTIYGPAATKQAITVRGRSEQYAGHPETWSGVWAEHIVVSDNDVDAGPNSGQLVEFAPTNTGCNEYIRDIVFERNYVHGSVGTMIVSEASENVTIRNNLFIPSDNDVYTSPTIYVLHKNTYIPAPTSHYIYNNSFYRPAGANPHYEAIGVATGNGVVTYPTGTVAKNNLVYAPFSTGNDYSGSATPVFIATSGPANNWTISNNSTDSQIKNTAPSFTTPPASLSDWRPLSGSYAIGSGAAVPVWDDFFLASRTGTYDMGAVVH